MLSKSQLASARLKKNCLRTLANRSSLNELEGLASVRVRESGKALARVQSRTLFSHMIGRNTTRNGFDRSLKEKVTVSSTKLLLAHGLTKSKESSTSYKPQRIMTPHFYVSRKQERRSPLVTPPPLYVLPNFPCLIFESSLKTLLMVPTNYEYDVLPSPPAYLNYYINLYY